MQLKLLNFYQFFSNFAVSLVSGFIPLIIYKATGSLLYSMLFLVIMSAVRIILIFLLKKPMEKKPQLMLLFRLFPIVGYSFALVYIEYNFWLNLAIIVVCYALQVTLKNGCTDTVFAYASDPSKSNSNASLYRILSNVASVVSMVLGGIFLGLNSTALILVAAGIYVVSVIPLLIFYFQNKSKESFNKGYTSNVQVAIEEEKVVVVNKGKEYKKLTKHLVLMTFVTTTLIAVGDYIGTYFNLYIFISGSSFAIAGYFSAIRTAAQIGGNALGKVLAKRFDNGFVAAIGSVMLAVLTPLFVVFSADWALYLVTIIFGFFVELVGYVVYININKGNVVGASENMQLYGRQLGISAGQILTGIPTIITASLPMCFYVTPVWFVIAAIYWPIKEESVRKKMVDYLMDNEI